MRFTFVSVLVLLASSLSAFAHFSPDKTHFVSIDAKTSLERTRLLEIGINIEEVYSDRVWALVTDEEIARAKKHGFKILTDASSEVYFRANSAYFTRSSETKTTGDKAPQFPNKDARFHDYTEMKAELEALHQANPSITQLHTIGKSWEGRDLIAIHINTSAADLNQAQSTKPGAVFMGAHHAREHLSSEMALMLAQYLLSHKSDPSITKLLETRDLWIIPLVNPDGAEFDIEGGSYHMWRKNRRNNDPEKERTYGVDLNRNYGYGWGTGGSSKIPSSDTYMGPKPFSEPETQAIRDFVTAHVNLKVLLSYHTFSELILYPWGGKKDPVENTQDRKTFELMARTMAKWNGYKPEQSSDLYIASGDTVDWAYGTFGIFAFTFELSPKSMLGGGFYPGAKAIEPTFQENLNPALYLIDLADDPHRVLSQGAGASIWYR